MFGLFKRKKKEPEEIYDGLFRKGDLVYFRHRGDRTYGHIRRAYRSEEGETLYDVQVGGQCPYILYGKKEEDLHLKNY